MIYQLSTIYRLVSMMHNAHIANGPFIVGCIFAIDNIVEMHAIGGGQIFTN